ncbi:MAG: hypothetical protein IPG22_06565 [Acidobacteria bacterium]|nr:hypothetical protein [Acidobacteriota bacterium]
MSLRPVMQQVLAKAQQEHGNYKQLTKENQMENQITKAMLMHEIYLYGIKMMQDTEEECQDQLRKIEKAISTVLNKVSEMDTQDSNKEKLPTLRANVYDAIGTERYYQEQKWGIIEDHPQSVGGYLTLMRVHLARAENAWASANNDTEALACLRKVLAIGVACGEQHGLPKRDFNNYPE